MITQAQRSLILVVEDDLSIRKILSIALQQDGYDVIEATSGQDALLYVDEVTPNLIISDIMMPDMDGLSMLTQLRDKPETRAIPLILLTALRGTDALIRGLNLGADDYLTKPFNIDELLARVRSKVARPPIPIDLLPSDWQTGALAPRAIRAEIAREFERARRGGGAGVLAYVELVDLPRLQQHLGGRSEAQIVKQLAELAGGGGRALDSFGRIGGERFALLLPETDAPTAHRRLSVLAQRIAGHTFRAGAERLRLTPAIGYAPFRAASDADTLHQQALAAANVAAAHLDLQPIRYSPAHDTASAAKQLAGRLSALRSRWGQLGAWLRLPFQLVLVLILFLVVPLILYAQLAMHGFDITPAAYIVVVVALLITAALIWTEGFLALRPAEPPAQPGAPHPVASAIIAAYLPNEAATIVETVETFLRQAYPGELQIILAYNSPYAMPVEHALREIAQRDARFVPLRVTNSTSKAQNVNAALAHVRGEFVGVFDADHHPQPDSFERAWRWLSNGYDIVQGHCLVRNGGESWVARTVAVEFEAIYAVSHPGRARLHNFGIFGGSNGYWRTDLLRQTRMHGFMLTEDIDSSLRVIESGHRIASDPLLISRELATTTVRAFWNQRLRWAQGWFQVSLRHVWRGVRSPHLSARQKLGLLQLLVWREVYPWISFQMFPIIVFWAWRLGGLSRIDWFVPLFLLTTALTQSVAIGQTYFAYRLAAPDIQRQRGWFVSFFFSSFFFFTPFKNLIAMVAQIKEYLRERQWKVTPRSSG
jgi:cellulose synthase/poly-beta-1,6-N-acetylglucosamine synthase-like glycosyltransferase/DNA-binding NarL/FixJ family response regulator